MAKNHTLKFQRIVEAKPSDVYIAFTNSSILREWFCDVASTDAHKSGRFYVAWNGGYYASGEYLSLKPDRAVSFSWHGKGEPAPTRVQVSIAEKKGRAVVTVSHSEIGSGKAWAKSAKEFTDGWEQSLDNLKSTLETGEDLRITLRPMMGVAVGSFDREVAKRLGVPVIEGVRLDSVVEGMGAHAAGLQKDDVIVSLAGKKVVGGLAWTSILQSRRAGDRVAVKFYRGGELRATTMQLSKRPLPAIPATAADLAEAARARYAELDSELEQCFEGVTEEEASFKPAPSEWSAKDVLCHLLIGERDNHSVITEFITGVQRSYDDYGDNVTARHTALMSVLPTHRALLDEYKRAEAESVALFAAFPPEAVARKSSWWRLCFITLQPPAHTRLHHDQIRAAIAAARKQE